MAGSFFYKLLNNNMMNKEKNFRQEVEHFIQVLEAEIKKTER